MAATGNKSDAANSTQHAMPEAFAGVKVAEATSAPKVARGRAASSGPQPEIVFCRQGLEDSLKTGKIKIFEGVTPEKREYFARYIRQAGALTGDESKDFTHKGTIKVETRYDKASGTLYWGPQELVRKLASAQPEAQAS